MKMTLMFVMKNIRRSGLSTQAMEQKEIENLGN